MSARQQFIELVEDHHGSNLSPTTDFGLARLALLAVQILRNDSPAAQAATQNALQQIAILVDQARAAGCEQGIDRFVEHLRSDLGFCGNADNYYTIDNSDLSKVLELRSGIPITLAIIYIELGRPLGFDLQGLSFPGHFLVGLYDGDSTAEVMERTLIDPFLGQLTDRSARLQNLAWSQGSPSSVAQFSHEQQAIWFAPASSQQIGLRLIENMKQIFLQSKQMARALAAIELQLLLAPDDTALLAQQNSIATQIFGQEAPPALH